MAFAIPALLLLLLVVLLGPAIVILISFKRYKVRGQRYPHAHVHSQSCANVRIIYSWHAYEIAHEHVLPSPPLTSPSSVQSPQTTQALTDVITDGVKLRMRWWGGFDLIRRLMFILAVTLVDFIQPDYAQV